MMKKNGFIAISVVYSFFIIFMMLLLLIISSYVNSRYTYDIYKFDVKHKYAKDYTYNPVNKKLISVLEEVSEKLDPNMGWAISEEGNAIRVQGPIPDNFVCVPTAEDPKCENSNSNLYRIVGVFGQDFHGVTGQDLVKVVKYRRTKVAQMDTLNATSFTGTSMYKYLNEEFGPQLEAIAPNFVYSQPVRWYTGGAASADVNVSTAMSLELASSYITGKYGLIYSSDWAYGSMVGTTNNTCKRDLLLGDYSGVSTDSIKRTCNLYNWHSDNMWLIDNNGGGQYHNLDGQRLNIAMKNKETGVKPAFYLNPELSVIEGTGELAHPYILGVVSDEDAA